MWRRRERRRAPPFDWPLVTHTPPLARYQGEFLRAAESLRMRLAGDTDELDVGRTIDATIRAAGFPTMQYRARRKTPEYLFLIERRTPEDHFARWWEDVASALQRLGVTLQVYFYTGDFRRCYQQGSPVGIATSYLLDARESHFVLVVGQGRDLLQGSSSFPSWMEASLVKREHRVLLTPSAAFAWSSAERRVGQHLPVLPARVPNLSAAAGRWDAARWLAADSSELPDIPREYLDTPDGDPGDLPSIAMFLDEDVFQWLCACAVYPKLEWRLTLEIGAKVDPGGSDLLRAQAPATHPSSLVPRWQDARRLARTAHRTARSPHRCRGAQSRPRRRSQPTARHPEASRAISRICKSPPRSTGLRPRTPIAALPWSPP